MPAALPTWRTSSYSGQNGSCVEVTGRGSRIVVRDTKDRTGPTLAFGAQEWTAFLAALR